MCAALPAEKRGGRVRKIRVVTNAGGADDRVRDDAVADGQRGLEPAIRFGEVAHEFVAHRHSLHVAEPIAVVHKRPERDGIEVPARDRSFLDKRRERVDIAGVEMSVDARPQEHAFRHVLSPEAHRMADSQRLDGVLQRKRRRRETVRPRPIMRLSLIHI